MAIIYLFFLPFIGLSARKPNPILTDLNIDNMIVNLF